MAQERWLTVVELAKVVGVARQSAHEAVSKARKGTPWNGCTLTVREIAGKQGGRSGTRYEVALSSLSEAFQNRYWAGTDRLGDVGNDFQRLPTECAAPRPIGCGHAIATNQNAKIERRRLALHEAMLTERRSAERRDAIERAHRLTGIATRTLYRWLEALELAGGDSNALAHKRPSDAGQRRVWVSRRFDKRFTAAGLDPALLTDFGNRVDQLTKAAWASEVQRAGWKQVRPTCRKAASSNRSTFARSTSARTIGRHTTTRSRAYGATTPRWRPWRRS